MKSNSPVGILGAGITGLSAAWAFKNRGIDVAIYEKQSWVGGKIRTFRKDGWLVEEGPNTILVRDQKIWNFIEELNLSKHILKPGPEAKKRFIVKDGTPDPLPDSVVSFLTSNLLSAKAKLRLLKEPFITPPKKVDESIAGFIQRRLGVELLEYAVDPFISGVYAGDPEKLSIKHTFSELFELEQTYGSLTKGLLKRKKKSNRAERSLISFDEGLQLLPRTIAKRLKPAIHLNTEVTKITRSQDDWKITSIRNGDEMTSKHQAIISTLPMHQLTRIWDEENPRKVSSNFKEIEYAPVSILALGFRNEQIEHPLDGFGMLIPRKEPYSFLGCLFSSTLFGECTPENHALLTCFIGGMRNQEAAAISTETSITKIIPELDHLLGIKGDPVFHHYAFQKHAIPQYTIGYQKYLDAMETLESQNRGLFLAGNFRNGVSVPDCILHGFETAGKVTRFLQSFPE